MPVRSYFAFFLRDLVEVLVALDLLLQLVLVLHQQRQHHRLSLDLLLPPPAQAQAGQAKQPGLLAQMASTAGGVAAGSVMGHGISNMLWGGRGEAAAPASAQTTSSGGTCEFQAKEFTKCLDGADVQTCTWFLDQLKACQAAASPY